LKKLKINRISNEGWWSSNKGNSIWHHVPLSSLFDVKQLRTYNP
jgi:hypothetical protein